MRSPKSQPPDQTGVDEAVKELGDATAAKKCWHCGCLHSSLRAIEESYSESARPESLAAIVQLARAEQALLKDGSYVQDAAPELQAPFQVLNEHSTELSGCGCGSSCRENKHA